MQPEKLPAPRFVTEAGIVKLDPPVLALVKPVQPEKAPSPMLVTLEGMAMLKRPVQFWNA